MRHLNAASNQSTSSKSTTSSLYASSVCSSSLVTKRKIDEIFRRMQPHSLVQSSEKLLATLKISLKLFVNGVELLPVKSSASGIALAASMARTGTKRPTPTLAAWRFNPEAGRFHYGLSFQYPNFDSELTLSALKDVRVFLQSSVMQTPRQIVAGQNWTLVAETDRRIGLALYEVALGDWGASTLIALVWTQSRQVAKFYMQLHTMELLYSGPQRYLQVRRDDDVDQRHGLHAFTTAISLRSLDELYWEREMFQVEFSMPEKGAENVRVELMDSVHGGHSAARDRMLNSATEPVLKLDTDAVKYAMSNCLLVDFTLWDADCNPVWGFSRVLELQSASSQQDEDEIDLSISSLGQATQRRLMHFQDTFRGNDLVISLINRSRSTSSNHSSNKSEMWVRQVTLGLSVDFINTTFCTRY
ncbi:hypothetical protein Plhal304r1_c001g0001761 [Plasmopara halstedii]